MTKKIIKAILIISFLTLGVGIFLFAPIDRRPLLERAYYNSMMAKLDTLIIEEHASNTSLWAGWARENIIPDFITPMAGYRPRDRYEDVHDSLFVHVIVLDNGTAKVAFISFDLLIAPPLLEKRLQKSRMDQIPDVDFIYLSASHTHNGIGGWDNSLGGQMMTGNFNEDILDHLESKTFECVKNASRNMSASKLSYFDVSANKYVQNRLDQNSPEDGVIRGIEIVNSNGEKAILTTFSAHATNILAQSLSISGDYPGQLNHYLEKAGYDFAMFMAGAVGSHRLDSVKGESFNLIKTAGKELASLIVNNKETAPLDGKTIPISFKNITLKLGKSQLRITDNFILRDWAFNAIFSPLEAEIKYLEIGKLLFLGMPGDFSGEILIENGIYDLAETLDKKLIVTSFNGDYIGYITEDHHYDISKRSEIREMNWVGPYYGTYFSEIASELIRK
jgi:neutral ceramidase